MYADDLALIAELEADLHVQAMLNTVSLYAFLWRYEFNAQKSSILVIGESPMSRKIARPKRCWYILGSSIPEKDQQKHLGILQTVSFTA